MEQNIKSTTICKSIFKNGECAITETQFTQMWINLINTLEKGKSVNFCEKG